jgi:hypothetical protein
VAARTDLVDVPDEDEPVVRRGQQLEVAVRALHHRGELALAQRVVGDALALLEVERDHLRRRQAGRRDKPCEHWDARMRARASMRTRMRVCVAARHEGSRSESESESGSARAQAAISAR